MQGKVWGCTRSIIQTPFFEVHKIIIEDGGFCSKHKHEHKFNLFYVESGCLEVTVYSATGIKDRTIITADEQTTVPAGVYHRFEALEDTVAYEMYGLEPLNPMDIVREDTGGVR